MGYPNPNPNPNTLTLTRIRSLTLTLTRYNTSGFTDAKLRVRFDGGGADAV